MILITTAKESGCTCSRALLLLQRYLYLPYACHRQILNINDLSGTCFLTLAVAYVFSACCWLFFFFLRLNACLFPTHLFHILHELHVIGPFVFPCPDSKIFRAA